MWQLVALVKPAAATARFTAFCTTLGSSWWASFHQLGPRDPAEAPQRLAR